MKTYSSDTRSTKRLRFPYSLYTSSGFSLDVGPGRLGVDLVSLVSTEHLNTRYLFVVLIYSGSKRPTTDV